jgi:transcription antitermination factor NusB
MDKRSRARELAMQALYQLDIQGPEVLGRLRGEFFYENESDERTRQLAWDWTSGTWAQVAECDEIIGAATIRWQFSRLSPVDRSILRLAVYQLQHCPEIPPKVVINEAIELAKRYSTEKSGPFVNGVLDAVLKKLKDKGHKPEPES